MDQAIKPLTVKSLYTMQDIHASACRNLRKPGGNFLLNKKYVEYNEMRDAVRELREQFRQWEILINRARNGRSNNMLKQVASAWNDAKYEVDSRFPVFFRDN